MLGMSIRSDAARARAMLRGYKRRITSLDPVRKDFAAYMEGSIERNFRAGGRPKKWKPSRRALRMNRKTLIKSGRLKNSITGKVSGKNVVIGTNVAYARAHQFGVNRTVTQRVKSHARKTRRGYRIVKTHTRKQRLNLPARPFLLVQREDRAYLIRKLRRHIRGRK